MGTLQGGVISPLLANLYTNRFSKHWRGTGRDEAYQLAVVAYADDFVILGRGHVAEAVARMRRRVTTQLGLALNETKTSMRDARRERFDFLGYGFGPHRFRKARATFARPAPRPQGWPLVCEASRSKTSVQRRRRSGATSRCPVDEVSSRQGARPEVGDQPNRLWRGRSAYFGHGTRMPVYRGDRQPRPGTGSRLSVSASQAADARHPPLPAEAVFDEVGVLQLWRVHLGATPDEVLNLLENGLGVHHR